MSTLLDALNSAPAPSDANPTTAGKQAPVSLLDALNSAPAPELNPSDLYEDIHATAKRHGVKLTSGHRTPEENARVKGAKRSIHLLKDDQGRPMAMDWGGSPQAMRAFYADLKQRRGSELAELIFGTPDHLDHVHTARRGKAIPKQAQKPIAAKGAQRTLDALNATPVQPGLPAPGVIPDLLDTPFAAAMRGEKMPGAVKRKAPGQERFARVAEAGAVQLPKGAPPVPKQRKGDIDPVNLYVVKPPTKLQQAGEVAAFVGKGLPGVGGKIQGHEDINRALAEAQKAGTAPASVPMAPAKSPLGKEQAASLERLRPLMEAYNARLSTELDAAKMSAPSAGAGGGYAPVGGAPDLRDVYVRLGQQWNWRDFGAFLKSQGVEKLNPWEQKLLNTAITAKKIEWGLKTGRDLRVSAEVAAAIIGEAVGAGLAPHIIRTLNITPAKNGLIRAFQPNEANVGNTIANTLQEGGLAATEEGATPLSVAQAAAQGAVTGYGATAALGGLGVTAKAGRRLVQAKGNLKRAHEIGEAEAPVASDYRTSERLKAAPAAPAAKPAPVAPVGPLTVGDQAFVEGYAVLGKLTVQQVDGKKARLVSADGKTVTVPVASVQKLEAPAGLTVAQPQPGTGTVTLDVAPKPTRTVKSKKAGAAAPAERGQPVSEAPVAAVTNAVPSGTNPVPDVAKPLNNGAAPATPAAAKPSTKGQPVGAVARVIDNPNPPDSKPTPKAAVQSDGSVVVDGYGTVKPDDARKLAEVVRLTNAGAKAEAQALGATLPKDLRTAGATITRAGALDDLLAAHPEAPKVPTRTAADIPLTPGDTKATSTGKLKVAKSGGKLVGGVESSDLLDLHRAANSENAAEELEALRGDWGDERFEAARKLRVELGGSGRLDTAIKELEGYAATEEAAQLADVDKLKAQEAKKTLAQAVERVSALSRGVVNAGENTARKGSPAVTFRDIGGSSVEDREALLAAVLAKNAKREGYRYQTKSGVLQNGANLRETIVEHGMLPSDVGVALKQDAPAAPKLDADGKKLPSKAALAKVKKAAAKLDLQAAVKSEFDALKKLASSGHLMTSTGIPEPEILAQAVKSGLKIARAAGRYGVATAEEFGLLLRERVGDVSDRYVKEVWDLYRAEKAGEQAAKQAATAKPPAEPPSTPSAKPASLPEPKTPEGQSIHNAATDALRDIAGLPERVRPDAQKVPEWAAEAERRGLKEKAAAIAREILDGNERQFTDAESLGVAARLDELETRRKDIAKRVQGKDATLQDAEDLADILDEQTLLLDATNKAGTAWGRAGVARQAYAKSDYSYTGMKARAMRDLKRNLTPEEDLKLRTQADELEQTRAAIAEEQAARANSDAALKQAEQDISDLRTQLGLQAVKLDELSRGGTPATGGTRTRTAPNADRVATLRQTQADALARAKQKLAAASKELGGGVPRAKGPGMRSGAVLNPVAVAKAAQRLAPIKDDILTYAKALVEEKAIQASELPGAVAKAFSEFGMPMSADEVRAVFAGAVKSLKPGEVEARVQSDWERVKAEALKPFKEAEAQQKTEAKIVTDAQKKAARLKAADALTRNREWKAEQDAKAKADRQSYAEWWKEQVTAQDNADKLAAKNAKIERLAAEKAQKARDAELAKEIADAAKAWEKGEREVAAAKTRAAKRLARQKPEAQKLLDRMQRIGEQRAFLQNGGKPIVGKNAKAPLSQTDPALRKLQLREARERIELDEMRAQFKRQGKLESQNGAERVIAALGDLFLGGPRTLLASGDISAPFNQAGTAALTDTRAWVEAWGPMLKAGGSEQHYKNVAAGIRLRENFDKYKVSRLELNTEGVSAGEEEFVSEMMKRIPGIKASERAYSAFLAEVRANMFDDWLSIAEQSGKPLSLDGQRELATAINVMTGRGAEYLAGAAPLTKPFFALRYRISQLETALGRPLFQTAFHGVRSGEWAPFKVAARKYMRMNSLAAATFGLGALALNQHAPKDEAGRPAAKLEAHPLAVDYGRAVFRRGNTTIAIDVLPPAMRTFGFLAKSVTGHSISTSGKEMKGSRARVDALGKWLLYGANPFISNSFNIADVLQDPEAESFGKSYDPRTGEGWKNLGLGALPLTLQGIIEAGTSKELTPTDRALLILLAPTGKGQQVREPKKPALP